MIAAVTRMCTFADAATFIDKDYRVLFGYTFNFFGSALGLRAMCSLRWRKLAAFNLNDLPIGREFQIFETCQIPTACPDSAPFAGFTLKGALAIKKASLLYFTLIELLNLVC